MKRYAVFFLLTLLLPVSADAQDVVRLALPNLEQLSSHRISQVIQDSEGFLWYATEGGGLCRDDGVTIHVRNSGIALPAYFMAAPRFETASDSPYGWLNDALFVCAPQSDPAFRGVVLNVWRVVPPQMSK